MLRFPCHTPLFEVTALPRYYILRNPPNHCLLTECWQECEDFEVFVHQPLSNNDSILLFFNLPLCLYMLAIDNAVPNLYGEVRVVVVSPLWMQQ